MYLWQFSLMQTFICSITHFNIKTSDFSPAATENSERYTAFTRFTTNTLGCLIISVWIVYYSLPFPFLFNTHVPTEGPFRLRALDNIIQTFCVQSVKLEEENVF